MDHRCGIRKPSSLNIALECSAWSYIAGAMRDIGRGGAFVQTSFDTGSGRLTPRTPVRLLVPCPGRAPRRIPAVVVWTHNHGVGLMFTRYDDNTVALLRTCGIEDGGQADAVSVYRAVAGR